jgi:hypothetical protein
MKFHGWRIAWALAVTQTVSYGVLYYAYSVFTVPMEAELGLTRAQTSGAYSLGLLLSGLAAMPIGRWVDARGARVPMSVGSLLGAACVLLWSYTGSLTGLFLAQAGIGLAMGLTLYDVAFTVLAAWFRRDRIKAMLVVTMVAGLASTIFVPVATAALEEFGWRVALRLLALVLAASCIPLHALVLRDHPRRLGQEPDGAPRRALGPGLVRDAVAAGEPPEPATGAREALRSGLFWWLTAAFVADRLAIVAIAAHSVPLLLERGYAPGLVAAVAGSIGLVQVVGRVVFAPAARVFSLYTLAVGTYLTRVVALVVILAWPGGLGLWLFAAFFGLANGASTLVRGGLVGEAFGSANYGTINGTMATFIAASQTVAPLGVGLLHVRTGGYDAALWVLVGAGVVAAFAAQRARGAAAARRVTAQAA